MKVISFKDNVRIKRLTPALMHIFVNANIVMNRYEWVPELVFTSINDSTHGLNSRHYRDEAIDIRSKNFKDLSDKLMFKHALQDELGSRFTVLLEGLDTDNEHLHVQVKKGTIYP